MSDFSKVVLLFLFAVTGMKAQTILINPATDGGFNSGSTFSANGWTVANQGAGKTKWAVGTAVSSGAITGTSAYVSLDEGETNSAAGITGGRTVYFYRDVAIPAGQTNIALTFNWKSVGTTFQVFAAPTSVTPVGTDVQLNTPITIAGATTIFTATTNAVTQNGFAFVPPSFAGTTMRLIFMWSSSGSTTNPPAAIDNISLVSRTGGVEIASVATGNYTNPSTWDAGYVPSPADDVIINANNTITIDAKGIGANNLYIAGANAVLQFGTNSDEYTVINDLLVSGSGARFNVYETTNGKSLKVGHDITVASSGRLDVSVGSSSTNIGSLNLNGSSLQTISSDGTGLIGGTVTATGTTNTANMINQLIVSNTSSVTPNIDWQLNNVRIKNALRLNSGRVALGSNKIIIGNYAAIFSNNFTCNLGSGFIGGTIGRWYGTSATGVVIDPGVDYNPSTAALFPSLSATGANRWAFIYATSTSTAGELALVYTDSNSMNTGLSIADGGYTITNRYNGSWAITKDATYASTAGTFSLGLYAPGAYAVNDGSSRILYAAAAAPGAHTNGTTTPFVARKGLTIADLTAGAFYVGVNSASAQGATTKTSVATGDWNTASTWTPSGVPTCSDIVTIAAGHTVTVNGTASAAGVTVKGTLVNAGGAMTVGCTNNNAIFTNFGTHTVSGGTLTVNGGVYQRLGSSFNQTGGNIIVDSNAAGVAANSVGQGGSSFKIDTSNLNLTGGKITIVDPLVNNTQATTANSITSYTLASNAGDFTHLVNGSYPAGATTLQMSSFNSNQNIFGVGQLVSGAGIQAGTTVTAVTVGISISITLSLPTTAPISSASLTFSSMANGQYNIMFPTTGDFYNLAIGQTISGPGIQPGTTIVNAGGGIDGKGGVTLSLPISGLGTSPITSAQTMTMSGASSGCSSIILTAANPAIIVGQAVSGTGIQPGTTVTGTPATNGTAARIDLSLPASSAMVAPVALTFYDGNLNSYAFAYNSPVNYSAGLNHTLQIGDGVSTDKAAVTINGFLCNMAQGGGVLSLGNLVVDALDGNSRFCNMANALSVQNATTVTGGSVLKRFGSSGSWYFGGNVINNGSVFVGTTSLNLANLGFVNGVATVVPTTLPQTLAGTGVFYNNLNPALATASLTSLTVNNTSNGGVTIATPNFRISSTITMTAGIIHTSAATPLYQGLADLSVGSSIGGNFGPTCFIDGPFSKAIPLTNTAAFIFPVGKTSYTPITFSVTGGVNLTAEAFTTNTGTASANISGLSATRWKVTRNGTLGAFTDFKVSLGDASMTANNFAVQASTDQGTYDNVLGTATAFTPAAAGTTNTIAMTTATAGANFTGNFAYATVAACSTVNPGNTIADLTITQGITTQNTTATGMTNGSATVTLSAANAAIVTGLKISGTGVPTGATVSAITGTTLTMSLPANQTIATASTLTFTTTQSPTSLCGTQPVALSLQNAVTGAGVTYQWQSSADGSTYTNINGATAATYSANPTASTYYRCTVTCPFGPVTATSTPVQVTFGNSVTVTPASRCDAGTLTLEATASSGTVKWYSAATGGTVLGTGTSFTTPSLSTSTTYYAGAESTSSAYTAGKPFTGTSTQFNFISGLVFNAVTNVRLASVKVYPKQTSGAADAQAPITIRLFDKNGVQVPGTTVTFTPLLNTGTMGAVSQVVTLNYDIPAGTGYRLLVTSGMSSSNNLGRIGTGIIYPFTTGSLTFTAAASSYDTVETSAYSNFFDLSVTDVCASPRVAVLAKVGDYITTQPSNVNICSTTGAMASVSVATSAASATYTWQYRVVTATNTNPAWITITAANAGTIYTNYTTATLGITRPSTALPAKGTEYRVLVDTGCGAVLTSNTALLNSLAAAKGGTILVDANVCAGSSATFTVSGYVGTSFQWQSSPISTSTAPGVFTDIAGATGTTYTTTIQSTSDRSYRVVVTNGPCGETTATSATKTITINPKSVAGTVTGGGMICSGSSGSLKVAGYVGKIQWEYSTDGVNYTNAPKAADAQTVPFGTSSVSSTAASYVPTNITANVYFRAKITSGACSSAYTSAVQYVMATTAFVGVVSPATSLICPGTGTTLNVSTASGTITWQKSTNWLTALPTWTTVKNSTITLATGNLTASTAYRVMVTTGACSTVYSDIAVVNVVAKPLAKTVVANTTTPSGKTALTAMCTTDVSKILTIGAGYIGDIHWQTSTTSTTEGFTDIAGATSVSYNVTSPAIGPNYFRVRFTNSCGVEVIGAVVTVYYKDCAAAKVVEDEVVTKAPFAVVAYPNPYNDNFKLSLTTSNEDNIGIMVYDMTGKLVDQKEVRPSDMSELQIGDRYASGIYNVIVTQGAEVKTVRVIKR
ncbi:T9SS type A sorting domain-containing protein [Flavobacterium sp. XGLA_31]|uniref:Ig-like domain-containing protein n=1 Tax=Flavobacterium sp. XGLA_31 TaxID=3447666 RepID=UPI003F2C9A6D